MRGDAVPDTSSPASSAAPVSPVTPAPQHPLAERLYLAGYLADEAIATTLWLAGELQRPLLIEGDAGVGKTALATALARAEGRQLVRLQCHEGLDLSQAAY
ncbi:MAG: hypothetical protein RLZZ584_4504, partial [Pseudomonadota bacterium]